MRKVLAGHICHSMASREINYSLTCCVEACPPPPLCKCISVLPAFSPLLQAHPSPPYSPNLSRARRCGFLACRSQVTASLASPGRSWHAQVPVAASVRAARWSSTPCSQLQKSKVSPHPPPPSLGLAAFATAMHTGTLDELCSPPLPLFLNLAVHTPSIRAMQEAYQSSELQLEL